MKHLPAPWKVTSYRAGRNAFLLRVDATAQEFVDSFEANRRLIEAAPILLAGLKVATKAIDSLSTTFEDRTLAAKMAAANNVIKAYLVEIEGA